MDLDAVKALKFFRVGEKRTDGKLIDWSLADAHLFVMLDAIRQELGWWIRIIRETHVNRDWPAVDFTCGEMTERAVQVIGAYPVSFGVYAGTYGASYHIDTRSVGLYAAYPRWMAVRHKDRPAMARYEDLIDSISADWVYYTRTHALSFQALIDVQQLADKNFHQAQTRTV